MNVTAATGDYSIPYLVESSDSETEPQSLDEDSPSKEHQIITFIKRITRVEQIEK